MPFDATPGQSIESRIIDETLNILGPNGKNWIKGSGVDGRYCMLHALNTARHDLQLSGDETEARIIEAIRAFTGDYRKIPDFNDHPERTFADVQEVLHLAHSTKPSLEAFRVADWRSDPTALVAAIHRAEAEERGRKTFATDAVVAFGALLMMVAAICLPA